MTNSWADVWRFRKTLYELLASYILEPVQEENKQVLSQSFWRDFPIDVAANMRLEEGLKQLVACTSELEELSIEEAIEKVQVEYTDLFIGAGRPKAPPIESYYQSEKGLLFGPTTYEMKDILNKYGLESRKKDKQPEDHLGLELLFIAVLTENLQSLEKENHLSNVREQVLFIGKHLLTWIPKLCKDAKEHGDVGFYGGLIEVIWGVLLWDKKILEEFVNSYTYVTQ